MSTQFITLGVQIDQYSANTVDSELSTRIIDFQNNNDFAINSTLIFGGEEDLSIGTTPVSIEPTLTFGPVSIKFSFALNGIDTTLLFGNSTLNRFLTLNSIQSTVLFGEGFGFVSLGAAPVEPGAQFGTPSLQRPFHRSLIFKNDNITKLSGSTDDVEIASGIIVKASDSVSNTASSGTADLPSNPVGFIVVTINGTDYKMPYFNL